MDARRNDEPLDCDRLADLSMDHARLTLAADLLRQCRTVDATEALMDGMVGMIGHLRDRALAAIRTYRGS